MKNNKTITRYIEAYTPLLKRFIEAVEDTETENICEPFLPVFGKNYDNAHTKIMFMGWETRGMNGLKKYIDESKMDLNTGLFWWENEFDDFDFLKWGNNSHRDFWGFNLKVLAKLNNLEDSSLLYEEPHSEINSKILSSFAWCNTHSIERFEVTAKKNNVDFEHWNKVREAGEAFNRPKLMFDVLDPNLVIVMNWTNVGESEILEGLEVEFEETINPDYLYYYKIKHRDLHIFWTKHPIRLHFEAVDYDNLIQQIVSIFNTNFNNPPKYEQLPVQEM